MPRCKVQLLDEFHAASPLLIVFCVLSNSSGKRLEPTPDHRTERSHTHRPNGLARMRAQQRRICRHYKGTPCLETGAGCELLIFGIGGISNGGATAIYGLRPYGASLLTNASKVTKKSCPSIGPRYAQVPSFHRRSMGRAVRASMPYSANPAPAGLPTAQRFHSARWQGAFESSGTLGGRS